MQVWVLCAVLVASPVLLGVDGGSFRPVGRVLVLFRCLVTCGVGIKGGLYAGVVKAQAEVVAETLRVGLRQVSQAPLLPRCCSPSAPFASLLSLAIYSQ